MLLMKATSFNEDEVFREQAARQPEVSPDDPIFHLLDGPKSAIPEILACDSLLPVFKSGHQKLIQILTSEMGTFNVMNVFGETSDPKMIAKLSGLFLSPNSALLECLSRNINILETFSQLLFDRERLNHLRFGAMMQILTTATIKWPERMYALFYQSPTFWPSMLRSLDVDSVADAALQFLQAHERSYHGFLWGYLLAAVPDLAAVANPPNGWNVTAIGVVSSEAISVGPGHRLRLIKLLRMFALSFPDEAEFLDTISMLVRTALPNVTGSELIALFDLAMAVPKEQVVCDAAMKLILRRPAVLDPSLEKALEYLTRYYDDNNMEQITHFLFHILKEREWNSFIQQRVQALVALMLEQSPRKDDFVKRVQHIVAFVWNRRAPDCPRAKLSFLLQLGDMFGNYPGFDGWGLFLANVIRQFRKRESIPYDFRIPELGMDRALLNSLNPSPIQPRTARCVSNKHYRVAKTITRAPLGSSVEIALCHRRRHSMGNMLVKELASFGIQRALFNRSDSLLQKHGKRASLAPKSRTRRRVKHDRKSIAPKKKNCQVA